ncbi:MAG: hypothetical protein ACXWLH_06710, partial [Candidatus Saccharimonadales bacterium]
APNTAKSVSVSVKATSGVSINLLILMVVIAVAILVFLLIRKKGVPPFTRKDSTSGGTVVNQPSQTQTESIIIKPNKE